MTDEQTSHDPQMEAITAEENGEYEKAFALYEQLAHKGDTCGMTALARFYELGLVVEFDLEKSLYWDEKAAAAGDRTAMFNIAVTHRRHGNIRKSREWFEKALAAGDLSAALELAKLYSVSDKETETVKKYLGLVLQGKIGFDISEWDFEEAKALLDSLD